VTCDNTPECLNIKNRRSTIKDRNLACVKLVARSLGTSKLAGNWSVIEAWSAIAVNIKPVVCAVLLGACTVACSDRARRDADTAREHAAAAAHEAGEAARAADDASQSASRQLDRAADKTAQAGRRAADQADAAARRAADEAGAAAKRADRKARAAAGAAERTQ
jgi:hypothetical protein